MAIELIPIKCPEGGAIVKVEKERNKFYCSYCGTQIILNNENEHIYRKVDEAKIVEHEAEKEIELKELEIEEKIKGKNLRYRIIMFAVSILLIVIGTISLSINSDSSLGLLTLFGMMALMLSFI